MDIPSGDTRESNPENPSYSEAFRFLTALDCTTNYFCFQVFDDLKTRRDPRLARTLHGSLDHLFETLRLLNGKGAGIFVTVNAIKTGAERKIANLEKPRAMWQDDDHGFAGSYPLLPSIVVKSSRCKYQRFWVVAGLKPDPHQAIMRRLIQDYGSDPNAYDLVRVLRVPGFLHMKNPEKPFRVELIAASGWIYSVDQITAAFPPIWPTEPPQPKPFDRRVFDEAEFGHLIEALSYIDAHDRDVWCRIGMALRVEFGESGRHLWDAWSATSSKFNAKDQDKAWRSFKRTSGVTLGTIYHLAHCNGFRRGGRRYA
jgi:hypothetical protein